MTIYLDHAATSPVAADLLEDYRDWLLRFSANPSSQHAAGREAALALAGARDRLAGLLGTTAESLWFTSGATESITTVLRGYCTPRRYTPHLVISAGEHSAVHETAARLAGQGLKLTILPLDADGRPDLDAIPFSENAPPTLISLIWVSNETGAVTDISALVRWRQQHAPDARIHLDATQAAGRLPLDLAESGVDFASFSGHKWGAPKGGGLLYVRRERELEPLLVGGGQQAGRRAGTENAPLALALAQSLAAAQKKRLSLFAKARALKARLLQELENQGLSFLTLSPETALPHILSLSFPALRGATLQRLLSEQGIFVSLGSACSGGRQGENRVLTALGHGEATRLGALRLSFGDEHEEEDVVHVAERIADAIKRYGDARSWKN